jgi:acetoin utilization deacetylase AcuC-like enzyme
MADQPTTHQRVAVVTDDVFAEHVPPGFHPERPERLAAALRGVAARRGPSVHVPARPASREELAAVHDPAYLDALERAFARGQGFLDADTYFSAGTHEAAWRAAGGACALVDALIDGVAPIGALLARPPGHHATADRAMGFCILNNIAVAAAHARARGLERVAIVDWDVHHGNGTQAVFERDPSVLFVSLHQWPLYPGTGAAGETGAGEGRGTTVNVPLPAGSDGRTYAAAFEQLVLPVVSEFRPELMLISAGFDAHVRDPLGSMRLDDGAFAWMASRLRALADATAGGRIAMALEGGYDLRALEGGMAATLRGLSGDAELELVTPAASGEAQEAIRAAVRVQQAFWRGAL